MSSLRFKRFKRKVKRKSQYWEQFIVDIIYERRHGPWVRLLHYVLRVFSYVFNFIVQIRYSLYEKRIFRAQPLGCLVVVVGNLTVGGTGKTPVVETFARSLTKQGRKVAILSRGYKSKAEPLYKRFWRWMTHGQVPPPKVVSDGNCVLLDSEEAGDEPYMLARNLPGVVVLVDKNRFKAGYYAVRHFGVDTLLLDDGYQYLPLKGRLNLLLIDKTNPFGNGQLLPCGILREPIKHLKRASYVFLTKSDGKEDPELEATIQRYNPDAEIIECAHRAQHLQAVNRDGFLGLDSLDGARVASFSGIAAPESFESFLHNLGAQTIYNQRFLDHHRFSREELESFFKRAEEAGVNMVVTTEKDAVRVPEDFKPKLPFYYLRLEIEILSGGDDFNDAVARICFPKKAMKATRLA